MSAFEIIDWDQYAVPFQSVMPSEMARLNHEAAGMLYEKVADFGCGAGKIIPFVASEDAITGYTGIDMSADMVKRARWMTSQFPGKPIEIIESRIESVSIEPVDSAVSINSYYTWDDPMRVLKHISQHIKVGGGFVLATLNHHIDMPALLEEAKKEQVANPYWEAFAKQNLAICESPNTLLIGLDELIEQVRGVGFSIVRAHADYYGGGLNFLVLKKAASSWNTHD